MGVGSSQEKGESSSAMKEIKQRNVMKSEIGVGWMAKDFPR